MIVALLPRITAIAALFAALISVRAAEACSGLACVVGLLPEPGSEIPANAGGVLWEPNLWRALSPPLDPESAVWIDLTAGATLARSIESAPRGWVVRPVDALVPGHEYALDAPNCGSGQDRWVAAPVAPIPIAIGDLSVRAMGEEMLYEPYWDFSSGACESPKTFLAAWVDVELQWADGTEPWHDVVFLDTHVNGRSFLPMQLNEYWATHYAFGSSWRSDTRGQDRVWLRCDQGDERAEYEIQMIGELPGLDLVLSTPPVRITLACPESSDARADAGTLDADSFDAELSDAGARGPELELESGCACRTHPEASSSPWHLGMILLAMRIARQRTTLTIALPLRRR